MPEMPAAGEGHGHATLVGGGDDLGVALGAPILRIERLTRTRDLQPIDFEYLYYRGDGFRYQLRVERG